MTSSVAVPSEAYLEQEKWRAQARLLSGGTREFRRATNARVYLPPEEDEETQPRAGYVSEWDQRVGRSVVQPFFARAVRRAVASIFARPVKLRDDVPAEIRATDAGDGWWSDIDGCGNNGDVFFSRVAEDSIGDAGVSYVLVEHPTVSQDATGADLLDIGARPYLVHIKARQVLDVRQQVRNGRKRDVLVRIKERVELPGEDEWSPLEVDQIRILRAAPLDGRGKPIGFATWETQRKTKESDEDSWELWDSGPMSPHTEIPWVPYYTGYLDDKRAVTPFDDLGFLNILHAQRDSDIDDSFRISLGAQLHRWGIPKKDALAQRAIGPRRLLITEDAQGGAEWLERTGSAAKIAMEWQDRLEARMMALSNEPHVRRVGSETATGRWIDHTEAKTEVQAWSIAMRDHIEQCLRLMAVYRGAESGGGVDVYVQPRAAETDREVFADMLEMHKATGAPRVETLLEVLKIRGAIPDDIDIGMEAEMANGGGPGIEARVSTVMRAAMRAAGTEEAEIDRMLEAAMMME